MFFFRGGGIMNPIRGSGARLSAYRVRIEANCQAANERREGETVVYAERTARRYLRSLALPTEVDDAAAQARLENGVLQLTLPKKQGGEARRLTIN
jgi:HSP20 family protein